MPREYEIKEKALKCLASLHFKTNQSFEEYKNFIIDDEYTIDDLKEKMVVLKQEVENISTKFQKELEEIMKYKLKYMFNSTIDKMLEQMEKTKTNA